MAIRQNGRVVVWHQSVDKMCSEWGVGKNGLSVDYTGRGRNLSEAIPPYLGQKAS